MTGELRPKTSDEMAAGWQARMTATVDALEKLKDPQWQSLHKLAPETRAALIAVGRLSDEERRALRGVLMLSTTPRERVRAGRHVVSQLARLGLGFEDLSEDEVEKLTAP